MFSEEGNHQVEVFEEGILAGKLIHINTGVDYNGLPA
jgi:hypothetical protein